MARYYEKSSLGSYEEHTGLANPFSGVDVGTNSMPTFVDYDGDSDRDLVVGNGDGALKYFTRDGDSSLEEEDGGQNPFDQASPPTTKDSEYVRRREEKCLGRSGRS